MRTSTALALKMTFLAKRDKNNHNIILKSFVDIQYSSILWEHLNYLEGLLSKAFPSLNWIPYSVNERPTTPLKAFIFVLELDMHHSS